MNKNRSTKNYLTIKMMAQISGLNQQTIRAWENRYQVVQPKRLENYRRVYTLNDLEKIKLLSQLTHEGYKIGQLISLSPTELQKLLQETTSPVSEASASKQNLDQDQFRLLINEWMSALDSFKLESLRKEMTRAMVQWNLSDFLFKLVLEALKKLGEEVEKGRFTISQEHAFSEILRDLLGQILNTLQTETPHPLSFIFAAPESDYHEFGLLISAILCAKYRFKIHYLGPNLPSDDLLSTIKKLKAHIVVLGLAPLSDSETVQKQKRYLQNIEKKLSPSTKLWVGGQQWKNKELTSKKIHFFTNLQEFDEQLQKWGKR